MPHSRSCADQPRDRSTISGGRRSAPSAPAAPGVRLHGDGAAAGQQSPGSTGTAESRSTLFDRAGLQLPPQTRSSKSTSGFELPRELARLLLSSTHLLALLRASMRASAGAISIDWLRRRRHRESAPAFAAAARLNRARTGDLRLPQPPCPSHSAVNESCYALTYYCNYRLQ